MPTRSYDGDGITVHWDATRCIHTAICLRTLPAVFDTGRRPWVDVTAADAAAIADAVERCPTGALRYDRPDGGERPPEVTVALPVPNGPLVLRGAVALVGADGEVVEDLVRATLCRCGHSGNQPFCDNSHRRTAWESRPATATAARAEPAAPDEVCPPQPGFA